jgi:tRNA(fMet)-specific endonuclease VapC
LATRYLIDTNALSLLAHDEPIALDHLRQLQSGDSVNACFIVIGEWEYGIYNAPNADKQSQVRASDDKVLNALAGIWESTPEIASENGRIQARFRKNGKLIPTNDIWIAAVANVHGATLVTNDKHFEHVPDLYLTEWSVS